MLLLRLDNVNILSTTASMNRDMLYRDHCVAHLEGMMLLQNRHILDGDSEVTHMCLLGGAECIHE